MIYRLFMVSVGLGMVSLALLPSSAQAQFFQNSTGLASPVTTITFDEVTLAQNTVVMNQYAASGVTFSGLYYNPFPVARFSQTPPLLGNFTSDNSGPTNTTFSIFFSTARTSAAVTVITNAGSSIFTALNNGVVVFSSSATTTGSANDYYGFTGATFNQIQIVAGGSNGTATIDNLQLGAVAAPEPATLALLPLSLLPLVWQIVRRRKIEERQAMLTPETLG